MAEQETRDPTPREGARWINRPPTGEEFSAWFMEDVAPLLHEGLEPARYVGGITLIPGDEKLKIRHANGEREEIWRTVYAPFPQAGARVRYFWDLVATGDKWVGVIEPGQIPRVDRDALYNENLPPGFFRVVVRKATDTGDWIEYHYLGCSMRVAILRDVENVNLGAGKYRLEGIPVLQGTGTKSVPLLTSKGPDENALEKAETGAVARAMGQAGILVLPGSGVATAEDMRELETPAAGSEAAELPQADGEVEGEAAADPKEQMKVEIAEGMAKLEADQPEKHAEIQEWARERKIDFDSMNVAQVRAAHRKIAKALEG